MRTTGIQTWNRRSAWPSAARARPLPLAAALLASGANSCTASAPSSKHQAKAQLLHLNWRLLQILRWQCLGQAFIQR